MDTDKKKSNKIRAFASMSMGSSPTAGINLGSVENSAFPRFLLYLCGFQGFKGFKIPNGWAVILDLKMDTKWTQQTKMDTNMDTSADEIQHGIRYHFGNLIVIHRVHIITA